MKLKVNRKFRRPKQQPEESFFDLCKRIGTRSIRTAGMIGQGTKIHRFTLEVVDTEDGLGIMSCWSLCGSATWKSHLSPIFDDELECNCKKCNK